MPPFSFPQLASSIIQAPMAGSGINTTALVLEVCRAGGLGSIAGAYRTLDQLRTDIHTVRAATRAPFAVNIFAPVPTPPRPSDPASALALVSSWHRRFGLPEPSLPEDPTEPFDAQVALLLEERPPVVSFTFGLFPEPVVRALHDRSIFVIGTATTVDEALQLQATGVDAIVAQGAEAGGHRGSFTAPNHAIGTFALVPQIVDAVPLPVIASGGIMDGRGILAALALGASAVQMGTAFLTTHESGAPPAYKDRVLHAAATDTAFTAVFSGRVARGIVNPFLREAEAAAATLPYPWQNALTRPLRAEGVRRNIADVLSLWAGQAAPLARSESVAELMARLAAETRAVLQHLQSTSPSPDR
ncbi:MAG TPA: nitronate monooxygenase [Acidobacteriaceae bacterium]|nr:nitronate monooxygenase [Acidobacteriaceae bacterium]